MSDVFCERCVSAIYIVDRWKVNNNNNNRRENENENGGGGNWE